MKLAFDAAPVVEQTLIREALRVLDSVKFFDRLDQQLVLELADRTRAVSAESDLVAICNEIRHRRNFVQVMAIETAELIHGPDNLGED